MSLPASPVVPSATASALSPEERRWLHDKYEHLAAEESELSASRTSYFAAIGTVLVTGLVVSIADLYAHPSLLVITVSFMALLGILISFIWAVLLHRTNDAQALYREAALQLEEATPPIPGDLSGTVTLRSGEAVPVNLLRPYETHARRFSRSKEVSWMDRVNPPALTEVLPLVFLGLWAGVVVVAWVWFLAFQ